MVTPSREPGAISYCLPCEFAHDVGEWGRWPDKNGPATVPIVITAAAAIVIGSLHLLRAEYAVRGARLAASSRSDARTASLS